MEGLPRAPLGGVLCGSVTEEGWKQGKGKGGVSDGGAGSSLDGCGKLTRIPMSTAQFEVIARNLGKFKLYSLLLSFESM